MPARSAICPELRRDSVQFLWQHLGMARLQTCVCVGNKLRSILAMPLEGSLGTRLWSRKRHGIRFSGLRPNECSRVITPGSGQVTGARKGNAGTNLLQILVPGADRANPRVGLGVGRM